MVYLLELKQNAPPGQYIYIRGTATCGFILQYKHMGHQGLLPHFTEFQEIRMTVDLVTGHRFSHHVYGHVDGLHVF